ncbi:MAG TPA: hypothetical protein VFC63_09495 [Blastocatellia bacterium]|nr:hypothetical protein [Blastocatellia bacterium]
MSGYVKATLPLGIFELDTLGRVITYSTYNSDLRLKPRSEVIGRRFYEVIETASFLEDRILRVFRERVPFSKFYLQDDESDVRSVLLMFFPDSQSVMVKIDPEKASRGASAAA